MKKSATPSVQASGLLQRMFGVGAGAGNSLPVRKLMVAVLLLVVATFLGVFAVAQAQVADGTMTGVTLASGSPGTLAVSWKAPSPAPTDYRVRWAPAGSDYSSWKDDNETDRGNAYPAGDATSLTLSGLSEGTEFRVQARARYHKGEHKDSPWSGPWREVTATVSQPPPVPPVPAAPSLMGTALTPEGHVILLWQDPSDDSIAGYQVLRGTDADNLAVIEEDTESSGTTYTDASPPAGQTHTYAVQARNAAGLRPLSNTRTVTVTASEPGEEPVASQQQSCSGDELDPTPTAVTVDDVPIVVMSATAEYFVLYAQHKVDTSTTMELPVLVKRGEEGTTTLSESIAALPKDQYRVEKYLVANPADVDGDCVDDITELDNLGSMNPVNPAPVIDADDGGTAIPTHDAYNDDFAHSGVFTKFIIYDIDTARPKLYFMNTATHPLHDTFLERVGLERNDVVLGHMLYSSQLLAPDGTKGVYYFWGTNSRHSFTTVARVYTVVAAGMPFLSDNLALLMPNGLLTYYNANLALFQKSRMNRVFFDDLNPGITFSGLNPGEGYGRLRQLKADERPHPRDIVVYEALPNELPPVAGIISTVPQTPLSHVNLRAIQNGIPNAYIREFLNKPEYTPLLRTYVRLLVTETGWDLSPATAAQVEAHYAASRPTRAQTPRRDLSVTNITALSQVEFEDWDSFGVKAANVAVLGTLGFPDGTIPDGYAIPFYFYDEFMKANNFYTEIRDMIADEDFRTDFDEQEKELKKLRKKIKKGTTPQWIIDALTTMHKAYPEGQSLRYRSSTNNEDLPGFNGAGLYDSNTQHPHETVEDGIDKSLKQVYASLWNFRAFSERDFHRVDHLAAAMGVLVHPNYSDELANGVAISYDILSAKDGTHYVNSQLGEDLVTNPEAHSVPEEILIYQDGTFSILATSNLVAPGVLLMTVPQMQQLRRHLGDIHTHFKGLYNPAADEPFAMEIEFKITSENVLAIKQARPWVFGAATTPSPDRAGTVTLTLRSTEPQVGAALTATLTDPDGSISNIIWQWASSPDGNPNWATISGAASATYTPVDGDVGSYLRAVASYTDSHGPGKTATAVSANQVRAAPPVPEPPVFPVDGNYDRSIRENTRAGANLGAPVRATDANNDRLTYSIPASDYFEIDASSGQLRTKAELDHEDRSTHAIIVTATDPGGETDTVTVTITVTDVNEGPAVTGRNSYTVEENQELSGADFFATDPEGDSVARWSLSGTDGGDFLISETGVLTFRNTPDYERPADSNRDNEYLVMVRAYDNQNAYGSLDIIITVTPVDEAPTITTTSSSATGLRQPENRTSRLYTYRATDPEGSSITWSVGGPDGNEFRISETGALTFGSSPDYESPAGANGNEYLVTVRAQDEGLNTATLDVTVTVTPVNEPPTVNGLDTRAIDENDENFSGSYSASDPESASTTFTWSLSGTDRGDFNISQDGELTFRNTPDYERPADSGGNNEYLVTVRASDGQYTGMLNVAVTVRDVNDTRGITFTPAARTIREGATGTYDVKLNTAPTADVTVAISSDNADVTVNKSSLTFTTVNYARNQRVTVTAGQDADAADGTANLTHRPSGGDYSAGEAKDFMVTVTDDDTAGLVLSATTLGVDEAGQNTYTVKLQTQPTVTVTVTVSSDDTGAATVIFYPLIFTASNWETEQTVTVEGVDDGDSANETVTVTNTASGGEYEGVTASVRVTVDDDDKPGITFTPASLTVGEAGVGRYGVRLNAAPTADVTVAISSSNPDVTVNKSSLTFTTVNYATNQRVDVTAAEDADAADDTANLRHRPSGGDYSAGEAKDLIVTVTDYDTARLELSVWFLDVDEGGQKTYTVKLQTQPTTTVTVTVSSDDTDAATVSGSTLRFTPSNWDTEQTVTVRGVNDGDSDGELVTITNTASGGEYAGVTETVRLFVDDDDTRGITFTPAARTIREGATGTYDVKLNTAPTADVTVAISSDNPDVTVNKSSLTFTTVNYARNQRVTVTAGQDADAADDTANLTHRPSGGDYSAGEAKDFMVTVTDDDTAGLVLSATTLGVDEAGQNTYTVKLQTQPTTTVTVTVSSDDPGAATVIFSPLRFTTSNWETEQTVTVEGVDDGDSANETVTVTNTASGGEYEGVTASVRVTVDDDDKPGITFTPASLTVGEAGVGTYGVRLNAAPTADVTVAISSSNPDVTVNKSSLTFSTVNYATNQRVDVTAAEDADAADDTANLRHRPSGGDYSAGEAKDFMVTVTDDDTAGLMLSATTLGVDEGGQNTYTVKLQTQPTTTVTVTVSSDDTDAATVSGPTLRFTPSNWDTEQTVTVRGVNDGDSDDETVTVTNTASGGEYAGVTETVTVTVDDDDTRGITFTPAARTIREGATGTYDVRLNTAPTADVTVAISSDNADVTVNKSSLTFTTVNYATNQRVTVTAGQDADAADGTANLTHRPSGGDYSAGEAKDFMVTVTDDDTAGLVLSATTLGVDEAGQNTYTVKLQTQPTTTVTVTVSSDDTGAATVIFYPLRFTTSNWDTERTVIVEGVDDGDSANETVTVTNTASGGEYEGVTASVRVTVDDDDKPGITFTPASLTVGEAGVGTYGVRLNAAPTADVTVAISSSNPDVTVNTSSLTFTTVNYATNQRVDVTAAEDADAADDTANLRHRPSGGDYSAGEAKDFMVTVTDDDTAGLMLSTPTLGVDEGGQNTYTVKLQTQPTTTVTVTVSSDDTDAATVSGPTLRFTTSNWDTEQTVTVRGVNDGDSDGEFVTVTNTASGGEYAGETETVTVTVDDDDTRGITFTPAARTIREGATGTYDVKLTVTNTARAHGGRDRGGISSDNATRT